MGGKRIDCTPTPAMWIGPPGPSLLTHAPGALHSRAGYSPKTPQFYPMVCPEIGRKTTPFACFGAPGPEINTHTAHKVIDNGFVDCVGLHRVFMFFQESFMGNKLYVGN
eukprot:gene38348-50336_t